MDFYGFNSEVSEANAMQGSADLANAAYNNYNAAAQNNWRNDMIKAAQPAVDAAGNTVKADTKREEEEGGKQGGGTLAGTYGVYQTGKSIAETLSNQGKAIRIAEAQFKLATASGDVNEINKATEMLKTANTGKMADYAKAASKLADSKLGGKNIEEALKLAEKIRTGSSFNVATSTLAGTKSGRAASKIIAESAEKMKAAKAAAKQAAEDAAEGGGEDIAAVTGSAADLVAPAATSATSIGEGIVNVGDRLAAAATAAISQGTAATTSAVNTATTAVDTTAAPLADTAAQVAGDAADAAPVATTAVRGLFNQTPSRIATFNPEDLETDNFLIDGESSLGNRGSRMGGGFLSRFARQIDLGQDVRDLPVGAEIGEGGTVAQKVNGFNAMADAARPTLPPRTSTATIPEEPETATLNEEEMGNEGGTGGGGDADVVAPAAEPARPSEQQTGEEDNEREAQTDEQTGGEDGGQGGEESVNTVPDDPAPEAVRGAEGADEIAVRAGTAAHEAEVAAHGFDSRALDAGGEALAAAAEGGGMATKIGAAIGGTALKGIKLGAKGLKVAGPAMSAGFAVYQGYEEEQSIASGKGLSGDGVQGKIGGVLSEIGSIAGTAAPILAAFGPLGDAAALGVEIGGGLLSLGGDLLGDWGTYDKEKAQRAKDQATKAAAAKKQQAYSTAVNTAVQTAAAGGNVNLSGQGTIAQSAQSTIRAY